MPIIVDQFNRPVKFSGNKPTQPQSSSWGLYATPRNSGESDYYRQRYWGLTDLSSALNDFDWLEILELSRQLFAQVPILSHAVRQKNEYAFGDAWIPQYRGTNKAWGEASEDWIHNVWLPQCSHAGGCSDWQSDLFLSGVAWDVDGDDVALFTIDDDGFPRIAYRSAHQIGNGTSSAEVKGGPFDGATIRNGIICDRNGRFLGIRLLRNGRYSTATANGQEQPWEDIPANQCDFQYEGIWRAQKRGMPRLASAIMDMLDIQDIKTFLKRGVKLDSSIGLMHYNEHGQAMPNSDILDEPEDTTAGDNNAADVKIEKRYGGEILYMRAGIGETLQTLDTTRPHSNAMEFYAGLERGGLLALGWFRELIDPSKVGGASVRLIQDQARTSVKSRQKTGKKRATRALYFALAQAMNTGRIPRNDDPMDWMQWEFGMPACLTVDAGYDEQADRENLLIGTATLDSVAQKKGAYWQDNRAQRLIENQDLVDKSIALMNYANSLVSEPSEKLGLREAMAMMQGSSNMPDPLKAAIKDDPNGEEEETEDTE